MRQQSKRINVSSIRRRKTSGISDIFQLIILAGGVTWLLLRGAAEMHYVWQWHRIPQYLYRIVDGELIFGPLIDGLMVTLEIGAYSIVLGLFIGLITAFLRLSDSYSGRLLATIYLEIVRKHPASYSTVYFLLRFGANIRNKSVLGCSVMHLIFRRIICIGNYSWRNPFSTKGAKGSKL